MEHEKTSISKINARSFVKYILAEGSRDEKREILNCLESQLYMKGRMIYLQK